VPVQPFLAGLVQVAASNPFISRAPKLVMGGGEAEAWDQAQNMPSSFDPAGNTPVVR